ncbi:unnamed protein product [Linum trigynum]
MDKLKIFSWNVGGAGSKAFSRALKLAIQSHRPDFVVLQEPQISGEAANRVCDRLGFPNSIRVEAEGRMGGVWVFWDAGVFSVELFSACTQQISLRVSQPTGSSWMLTAVYASPRMSEQSRLWDSIVAQSHYIDIPWLLTGGFNAISSPDEKSGPPKSNTLRRCQVFTDRMNLAELVDLGFSGPKYTWSRGDQQQTYKASRLDRSLCNLRWNTSYPNTSVVHLPRFHSDHNPILTTVELQQGHQSLPRQFKFEAAWLTNDSLQEVVTESWNPSCPL